MDKMEISQFTWRLIVLFMPGLLTASMVNRFTVHKEWSNFDLIVRSLLFGVACYLLLYLLDSTPCFHGICDANIWNLFVKSDGLPSSQVFAIACGFSIPVAFGYSFVVRRKWVYKIAKKLGITSKSGEIDVWNFFLNVDEIQWVIVRFKDRPIVYEGSLSSFSEDGTTRELVLGDVRVHPTGDVGTFYELDFVYLSGEATTISIEIAKT